VTRLRQPTNSNMARIRQRVAFAGWASSLKLLTYTASIAKVRRTAYISRAQAMLASSATGSPVRMSEKAKRALILRLLLYKGASACTSAILQPSSAWLCQQPDCGHGPRIVRIPVTSAGRALIIHLTSRLGQTESAMKSPRLSKPRQSGRMPASGMAAAD
jgi:hypothetical protein